MILQGIAAMLYAAYNNHDLAAVELLYAPDATHQDMAQPLGRAGAPAIAAGLGKFFGWFADAHWEPELQLRGPDGEFAIAYLLTCTLGADMGPYPARGQPISLRGVHILRVSDGRIRRSEDYWDAETFKRQLNSIHMPEE